MNRFSRWLVVLVGVVLCLYPFLWMFLSSFKTNREIYQPTLLFPDSYDWGAYVSLFGGEYLSFFDSFANSLALSCGQAFLATLVSVGAGFALAKFRLRWAGSAFFFGRSPCGASEADSCGFDVRMVEPVWMARELVVPDSAGSGYGVGSDLLFAAFP